jgi:S1-C subfamily serine protease
MGSAAGLAERQPAMMATHSGTDEPLNLVYVVSRRPFTGSWEYLLDSAIYTYPPVLNWSGASLIGTRGELLGLGSLIVGDATGGGPESGGVRAPGNMFVPVDLLKPILDDLIRDGKAAGPVRPWLGLSTEELRGQLVVARVSPDGPADRAGLKEGDIVLGVGGDSVATLADFYRKVWGRGAAGVEVPVRVQQGMETRTVNVRSIDRAAYFRPRTTY